MIKKTFFCQEFFYSFNTLKESLTLFNSIIWTVCPLHLETQCKNVNIYLSLLLFHLSIPSQNKNLFKRWAKIWKSKQQSETVSDPFQISNMMIQTERGLVCFGKAWFKKLKPTLNSWKKLISAPAVYTVFLSLNNEEVNKRRPQAVRQLKHSGRTQQGSSFRESFKQTHLTAVECLHLWSTTHSSWVHKHPIVASPLINFVSENSSPDCILYY